MKLKTLKDLYRYCTRNAARKVHPYNSGDKVIVVQVNELKAEAIKWVKWLNKEDVLIYETGEKIDWIKHFFNITSEDLK